MLGRLYAFIFISLVVFSLWYQRKYLDLSSKEFNSQLDYENLILPISTVKNFTAYTYQEGKLKYSFSGNKINYFNDYHFEAEGNLLYQAFDETQKVIISIKTDKAYGYIQTNGSQSSQTPLQFGSNSRFKSAELPGDVFFNFEENKGKANHVFIDLEEEIIKSSNPFTSNGPQGNLTGKGFIYSIKNEEFKIISNVDGNFKINNFSQNKSN